MINLLNNKNDFIIQVLSLILFCNLVLCLIHLLSPVSRPKMNWGLQKWDTLNGIFLFAGVKYPHTNFFVFQKLILMNTVNNIPCPWYLISRSLNPWYCYCVSCLNQLLDLLCCDFLLIFPKLVMCFIIKFIFIVSAISLINYFWIRNGIIKYLTICVYITELLGCTLIFIRRIYVYWYKTSFFLMR